MPTEVANRNFSLSVCVLGTNKYPGIRNIRKTLYSRTIGTKKYLEVGTVVRRKITTTITNN